MIRELLRKGDLDPANVLVLTNAIYFRKLRKLGTATQGN